MNAIETLQSLIDDPKSSDHVRDTASEMLASFNVLRIREHRDAYTFLGGVIEGLRGKVSKLDAKRPSVASEARAALSERRAAEEKRVMTDKSDDKRKPTMREKLEAPGSKVREMSIADYLISKGAKEIKPSGQGFVIGTGGKPTREMSISEHLQSLGSKLIKPSGKGFVIGTGGKPNAKKR